MDLMAFGVPHVLEVVEAGLVGVGVHTYVHGVKDRDGLYGVGDHFSAKKKCLEI